MRPRGAFPLSGAVELTPPEVNRAIDSAVEVPVELATEAAASAAAAQSTADTAASDILTTEQRLELLETNLLLLARHLVAQGIAVPDPIAEQL